MNCRVDSLPDETTCNHRRSWLETARYRVELSTDGDWNDKSLVAEWLQYDEATAMCDRLNGVLIAQRGGYLGFGSASYSMSLHVPLVKRKNRAAVGDLVLYEITTDVVQKHQATVFRRFHRPAKVTAVDDKGRVTTYQDAHGAHDGFPARPMVVSAAEIDVDGVLADIAAAVLERGSWAGEFVSTSQLQTFTVRRQKIQAPIYHAGAEA